jgi:hypothetical protein
VSSKNDEVRNPNGDSKTENIKDHPQMTQMNADEKTTFSRKAGLKKSGLCFYLRSSATSVDKSVFCCG